MKLIKKDTNKMDIIAIQGKTWELHFKMSNKDGSPVDRDGVGAINIFKRYRGKSHVVGVLASPVGVRFKPHLRSHGVSISPWKPALSR